MAWLLWLWLLLFFFALLLLLLFSFRPSSSSSSDYDSSSSSSTDAPKIKYDVFISFTGGDIRDNFLSHLKKEMLFKQIDFFVEDKNVHPGDQISPTLLQAIGESFISLVIFSEHYASSKWCMEELVKITECMKHYQRIVIPVFYNVEPNEVRHQKGTFAEAFDDHKRKYKVKEAELQKWRSVLKEIANISGIHYPSPKYGDESELIEDTVKQIWQKLSHHFSDAPEDLTGINEHFKFVQPLLAIESNEVRMVGIWGMGGIGKSTIAKAIFDRYASRYEGCCLLENVRAESQKSGQYFLYEKLISDLLEGEHLHVKGSPQERSNYVKRRLSRKKVLIVLDDVDTDMLDYLTREMTRKTREEISFGGDSKTREEICLGEGSRVIITTRDEQILIAKGVDRRYKVQRLSFESSLELLCLKAFHKSYPENGYKELSEMAVKYADGVPLALKVLGSSLRLATIKEWEDALGKLKDHPDPNIFNVLKLSYDGLDDLEKKIFLDIAFFFKGKHKGDIIRFADSCDFHGIIGIRNLQRKDLITISPRNKIRMHDLIEQMGLEIVFNDSNEDLEKCSRLRNPEDVRDLLQNSEENNSVEGITCDLSQIGHLSLNANAFKNMRRLRFLKLYAPRDGRPLNVNVPADLESFPAKLRYLEWHSYPLDSLRSRFNIKNLVELRMPYSQISKLWDGTQDVPNLAVLKLPGCKNLVELPDLSRATKLKKIELVECEKLCELHPSVLSSPTLEVLRVGDCKELKSLKGNFKSLKIVHARGCSSLEEFSVWSEELRSLDLSSSRIKNLPNDFCSILSLRSIRLNDCRELIELPHNIKALSKLWQLEVIGCRGLRSIPELPRSIRIFEAVDCTSLETIFSWKLVPSLKRKNISFGNCISLKEESLNDIMEETYRTIIRNVLLRLPRAINRKMSIINPYNSLDLINSAYPGSEVLDWFPCQRADRSITIELDQPYDQLLGFVFCCVVSQNLPGYYFNKLGVSCIMCEYLHLDDGVKRSSRGRYVVGERRLNSDLVLIWSCPFVGSKILSSDDDDDSTCNQQEVSFGFSASRQGPNRKLKERNGESFIKGCGVFPVYASTV